MKSPADPAVVDVTVQYAVLHGRVFVDGRDVVAAMRDANYYDAADAIKELVEHFEQLANTRRKGRR